jgi:peptide/nickel transport system substrate-binding protein
MLKQRGLWPTVIGALVVLTMVLSACGPTAGGGGGGTGSSTPKQGGSITDAIQEEPSSLMPQQSTETFSDLVDASIWATMLYSCQVNGQYQICPGLATEVPTTSNGGINISGGKETVTFHMRPNLKFSDGQPLTSADVAYTIKLFGDPGYGAKDGFPSSEISSVSTPDASTVVISLNTVDAAFLALAFVDPLTFTPLPQHIYGSMAPGTVAKEFTPKVTSGPFVPSVHVSGSHITVVKNKKYYQAPKPYLNQVTFQVFQDASTIVTSLQGGQVDTAYFLPVTNASTLANISGYKLWHLNTSPNYEALYFNLSNPILADPKVRQALAMAFDPREEISRIEKGYAIPTCDDSSGTFAHEQNLAQGGLCPYGPNLKATVNPTAAGNLLTSDGWTMGPNGYRQKNGQTLTLRIATTSGRQYRLESEQLIQAAWKNIGVQLNVQNYPASDLFGPVLFPTSGNGNWDVAEYENSIGVDPDNHLTWDCNQTPPQGGTNLTHYCNKQLDSWEANQVTSPSQSARMPYFHDIHVQLLKDIPIVYLYAPEDLDEYRANLHNYMPDDIGPAETWNIWDWYLG